MTEKDWQELHSEIIVLRNNFEACRQHSCEQADHITSLIKALRLEIVGLGQTASDVAKETKAEIFVALAGLRRDLEALVDLLGEKGHA